MSLAVVALASSMAARRDPVPESKLFTTVKVAGTTLSSRLTSSSLPRIPFFNAILVVFGVKSLLKAFNIGQNSFNKKPFNCTAIKNAIQEHYRYK